MSFYSSISNAGKTSLTFDKVYPNRKMMEDSCQNDEVFIGRCVLVEYDDNTFAYNNGYIDIRPSEGSNVLYALYADTTKQHPFILKAQTQEDEGYVLQIGSLVRAKLIDSRGNIASTSTFFFSCEDKDPDGDIALFNFIKEDKEFLTDYDLNYNVDKAAYEENFQSGWDSTVWQKVVEEGTIKYKMIASLNSGLPIFNVQGLAPRTEPQAPFFSPTSTNIHYTLLTPTAWGFKVKNVEDDKKLLSDERVIYDLNGKDKDEDEDEDKGKTRAKGEEDEDEKDKDKEKDEEKENTDPNKEDLEGVPYNGAIYYNRAGFDKLRRNISDVENKISVTPTGYSTSEPQYYDEENGGKNLVSKPDMQELVIQLPAIGNVVAELWDLMYGEKDSTGKYHSSRNDNIEWNDTTGLRMIQEDLDAGGFKYSENKSESVAGAINSVHDLMGMIIVPQTENQTKEEALEMAVSNKIYFGAYGDNPDQKGFYYKDTEYKFEPFTSIPKLNEKYKAEGKEVPFPDFPEEDFNIDDFISARNYYELNQFWPNTYYTYVDKNFYLDINNTPTPDTVYYELGTPQPVSLKEWHGEAAPETPTQKPGDDDDNPTIPEASPNVVYYIDNKNYINDTNDVADEHKDYFMLSVTQETFPVSSGGQIKTYLWNPKNPIQIENPDFSEVLDLDLLTDEYLKKLDEFQLFENGLFFEIYNEKGEPKNLNLVTEGASFDLNKNYYKIPQYIAIPQEGHIEGEPPVYVYYFIRADKSIIPFEDVAGQIEGANYSYENRRVSFKEFEEDKFYFAAEFTVGEGDSEKTEKGYKLLLAEAGIDDNVVYYSIIATPTTGDGYIDSNPPAEDEGEEPVEPDTPEEDTSEIVLTHYYKPGVYYIKNATNDYILSNSLTMHPEQTYYILTDKDNNPLVKDETTGLFKLNPVEGKFYEPNKYYYFSIEFGSNLMDTSVTMKLPSDPDVDPEYVREEEQPDGSIKKFVYFIPQEAYVVNDTAGFLSKGMVWDKASDPPATVTLGGRYEEPKWTELKGFSRTLNTINGLILQLNKYFKFDDPYIRDNTTIQGCLNQLKDIINLTDDLNPGNIMIVDDYGRMSGGRLETDGWINPTIETKAKNASLILEHTLPQVADNELTNIGGLKVDKNGHVRGAGSITVESLNSTVDTLSGKIDKLNGDASTAGSVANTATSIAAAEVAKIVNDNNNGSIDTLNEIAAWIINDTTGAANMANDIATLEQLVGNTAVATQISTAIDAALKTGDVDKYALASELTSISNRIKDLEDIVTTEKVAQWNSAEANVQSNWTEADSNSDAYIKNKPDLSVYENVQPDWNATDATSDAFILNKPDLSNYITNSQEFTYEYNDSVTNMTIQELLTYIAGLEARIKVLEDAASTPTT